MNFDAERTKLLMQAINALHKSCPREVYIVIDDSIERMRVDKMELHLESGSVILVNKNTGNIGEPVCKRHLAAVILDEDEAMRRWKEKGQK